MANSIERWTALYDAAVTAILNGMLSNYSFGDFSMKTLVIEAISGADLLIEELKNREETQQ